MKRRAFLTGTSAALLAGCSSPLQSPPGDPNPGPEAVGDRWPVFEVSETAVTPDADLDLRVRRTDGFTDDSPAHLAIRVTSAAETARTFTTGPAAPFGPTVGEHASGEARLFLLPADGTGYVPMRERSESGAPNGTGDGERAPLVPEQPTDGCWKARSGRFLVPLPAHGTTLAPGESAEGTYVLLVDPGNDACLPPGDYVFADTLGGEDGTDVSLTFTLSVLDL